MLNLIDGTKFEKQNNTSSITEQLLSCPSIQLIVSQFLSADFHHPTLISCPSAPSVYVYQKEYVLFNSLTSKPIQYICASEATTCLIICFDSFNEETKEHVVLFTHIDGSKHQIFDLKKVILNHFQSNKKQIRVNVVGGFDDEDQKEYSKKICDEFFSMLYEIPDYHFHLELCCVYLLNNYSKTIEVEQNLFDEEDEIVEEDFLENNMVTKQTITANAPIVTSLCIDLTTRKVNPVRFTEEVSKGPELRLRSAMSMFSEEKLLQVYDSQRDEYLFGPNDRFTNQKYCYRCDIMPSFLKSVLKCSDLQILMDWSTSPLAEADDFPQHMRQTISFLLQHPDSKNYLKPFKLYSRLKDSNEWKLQ